MDLGEQIYQNRKKLRLTQEQLADTLGVSRQAVSKWETNLSVPTLEKTLQLAQLFGVSIETLLETGEVISQDKLQQPPQLETATASVLPTGNTVKKPVAFLAGILMALAGVGLASLQGAVLVLGDRYKISYITTWMPFAIFAVVLVLFSAAAFLLAKPFGKKVLWIFQGVIILLFCVNFVWGIASRPRVYNTLYKSPKASQTLILKQDETTGKVIYCRSLYGIFAREKEQFPYTVIGDMKVQWLQEDICAITYQTDDQSVHQYIATYGDRGTGNSYSSMATAIWGNWQVASTNVAGWEIVVDTKGVLIKNGSNSQQFAYSDCVAFGTTALALCENGLPVWTLALNSDCQLDDNYLVTTGGKMTLCKVSMDKTATMEFTCTSARQSAITDTSQTDQSGEEQKLIGEMKKALVKDKTLADIGAGENYMKIANSSDDLFYIAMLALQKNKQAYAQNGVDCYVQLENCSIEAGSKEDCLVVIDTKQTAISPGNQGGSPQGETVNMKYRVRLMKGEGAYLAAIFRYNADGTQGLSVLQRVQKDFSDNLSYHFFVPGIYDTTYMYVGRLSPQQACEKLVQALKATYSSPQQIDPTLYLLDESSGLLLAYDGIMDDFKNYRFVLYHTDENQKATISERYAVNLQSGQVTPIV